MGKVTFYFICILLLVSCKNNSQVYLSEKNNLIVIINEKNKSFEGITIHPNFTKYNCNYYFNTKINQKSTSFQLFGIDKDSLSNIDIKLHGNLIFEIENKILYLKYKTQNIGCADWIFPQSNEHNTFDTFKLKEINVLKDPHIAIIKTEKIYKYSQLLNQFDLNNNFLIVFDSNNKTVNSLICGWKKTEFKSIYFKIDSLDYKILNNKNKSSS